MQGYLNYGVNDVKRDFREEVTELMKERIDYDIKALKNKYKSLKKVDVDVDLTIGECPLGWDVHIYFKKKTILNDMLWIADTVAKTIGIPLGAHNIEWEDGNDSYFKKAYFCADLIPYRELD